nr:hypothetical protein [Tanacetum cinerariifolium]
DCSSKGDFKFEKESQEIREEKRSRNHGLKRLYKIGLSARVESSVEEQSMSEEDASKQGRNIADIDADAKITLVNETAKDKGRIEETYSSVAPITIVDVTPDELTMAQALMDIKKSKPEHGATTTTTTVTIPTPDSTRPKARGVVMKDPSKTPTTTTTTVTIPTPDSTRPKARGVVMKDPSKTPTTTTTIPISSKVQDKGKTRTLQAEIDEQDRLAEEKAQTIENLAWDNVQAMIGADYELAARLQEEEQGELTIEEKSRLFVELMDKMVKDKTVLDRLAEEKAQTIENLAWDNVQAMIGADYELAARLQEEEQGELTIEEKSRLFVELMDKSKKHFAKLRVEEQTRKPPTKAQKRNQMCVHLKNMAGFSYTQLKNKSFNEVQKAFDKIMSWINSFVPMDSEVVKDKTVLTQESNSKRA